MLDVIAVETEIEAYREKLLALNDRYQRGARSVLALRAQQHGDALICLMEECPSARQRAAIDYLIDRFEALRISCLD